VLSPDQLKFSLQIRSHFIDAGLRALVRRPVAQHLAPLRSARRQYPAMPLLDVSLKSPKWFRLLPRRLAAMRLSLL